MFSLFIQCGDDLSNSVLIAQANDLKVIESIYKPMLKMELYNDVDFIVKHNGTLIRIQNNSSMKRVIEDIILALENGENQDDELNDLDDFLSAMGIDIDYEYLLKCSALEQAKYYLSIFKK